MSNNSDNDDREGAVSNYKIPMDEEVSKGRMNLIKNKLDALIYFYPEGIIIILKKRKET